MAKVAALCLIFALIISDIHSLPIIFFRPGSLAGPQHHTFNPMFGSQRVQLKRSDATLGDLAVDSDLIDEINMDDLSELLLRPASGNGFIKCSNLFCSNDNNAAEPKAKIRVQRRTPLSDSQSMKLSSLMSGGTTGLLLRPGK